MTKEAAIQIVKHYNEAHFGLDAILMTTFQYGSNEEQRRHELAVKEALGAMYRGILKPVLEQYPELTPDLLVERGRKPN